MDINEKFKFFKSVIARGDMEKIRKIVSQTKNCIEGEYLIYAIFEFKNQKFFPEFIDLALNKYLGIGLNDPGNYQDWIHSLSHITENLWRNKMYGWIKRFNEVSFRLAKEYNNPDCCCERLVNDFAEYAEWNFDPAEFFLIHENLDWMRWEEGYEFAKARADAGKFNSEKDYLLWKLAKLEVLLEKNS